MTNMSSHILLAKFLLHLSTFFLLHKNTKKTILFILHVMLNRFMPHTVKAGNDLSLHQWYITVQSTLEVIVSFFDRMLAQSKIFFIKIL